MKACVVFYSLTGNTKYAAEHLAEKLGADMLELKTVKPYTQKGFAKFLHGGKDAIFKAAPELEPYVFDADKYDVIVLGTPVWASRPAAPLRTFINENGEKMKEKLMYLFLCCAGGEEGAFKAGDAVCAMLGIKAFKAEPIVLVDPKDRQKNIQSADELSRLILNTQ